MFPDGKREEAEMLANQPVTGPGTDNMALPSGGGFWGFVGQCSRAGALLGSFGLLIFFVLCMYVFAVVIFA